MRQVFRIFICLLCASATVQAEDVLRPGSSSQGSSPSRNDARESRQWHAGFDAGLTFSMYSVDLTGVLSQSAFLPAESQSGLAPYISAYVDIPSSWNNSLSYRIKVAYDQKDYSNSGTAVVACTQEGTNLIVPATIDAEYDNSIAYLDLVPQLRWQANQNIFAVLGPVLQFAAGDIESTSTWEITSPEDCLFDTDGDGTFDSPILTASGENENTESFRLGLELGLGYSLPINDDMEFVISGSYQHMFTAPEADEIITDATQLGLVDEDGFIRGTNAILAENSALNSLIFTLGLRFGL